MTIKCQYSCNECGLKRITVVVPARQEEEVTDWMRETVIPHLIKDHSRRSTHCRPKTLTELLIPISGAEKIGGPAVN